MPIARINATGCKYASAKPLPVILHALADEAPVTIMLHGAGYAPGHPRNDPHTEILALRPTHHNPRITSWPRRLGFGVANAGLAVAFGWQARGRIWHSYAEAERAGQALASLIADLRTRHSGPIHLIGHSLGARVALCALPYLHEGDVTRIVALEAAEFRDAAEAALRSPAGRSVQLLNVTSRENDIFDFLFEIAFRPFRPRCPTLGVGLELPNTVTLQIDSADHLAALRSIGFRTAPARNLMCHWSAYLRPGLFPLYRSFLYRPDAMPFQRLKTALNAKPTPRWSRLHLPHLTRGPFAVD